MRQLAEHGNTRMLESELKAKSEHIRTIIKARGISAPSVTGKTFAVFRVDSRHHLMSLAAMLDPSPDWIVGVSELELCLVNCSWIEKQTVDLYPWDAGTDDGLTYTSPNRPSTPRQTITQITSSTPKDARSPFYDASGTPMRPLARLHLIRQRLYEKTCDSGSKGTALAPQSTYSFSSSLSHGEPDLCLMSEWGPWSSCSAQCGRGVKYRQRTYVSDQSKMRCAAKLTERASCWAPIRHCPEGASRLRHSGLVRHEDEGLCTLSEWSEWSGCSTLCGPGVKTRDRTYLNRYAAKRCGQSSSKMAPPAPPVQQNLDCIGTDCANAEPEATSSTANCTEWTLWSPCSATCGKGYKVRFPLRDTSCSKQTVECTKPACTTDRFSYENKSREAVCGLPKDVGACKSSVDRWFFDITKGTCDIFTYSGCEGNLNNFKTLERCQTVCADYQKQQAANFTGNRKQLEVSLSGVLSYNVQNDQELEVSSTELDPLTTRTPVTHNCEISKWTTWGHCRLNHPKKHCGHGTKIQIRYIKVPESNEDVDCSNHRLIRSKLCFVPCTTIP